MNRLTCGRRIWISLKARFGYDLPRLLGREGVDLSSKVHFIFSVELSGGGDISRVLLSQRATISREVDSPKLTFKCSRQELFEAFGEPLSITQHH